jgi:hypothetical protein
VLAALGGRLRGQKTVERLKNEHGPVFRDTPETSCEVIHLTEREDEHKDGTAVAVKKDMPHTCVDLLPLLLVDAAEVCVPIGNTEMFLASVYKSPRKLWSDTDITELLRFRNKSILAGDLNAEHPILNSKVSNPSGLKLLELFVICNFDISAPQCSTHYTPDGRGDVLDIVVHQNVRLSEATVTDTLGSDHLPIMFNILDHVRTSEAVDPVEMLTDWELFQSLASELISPNI